MKMKAEGILAKDSPTHASWKAMKTQADGILARHGINQQLFWEDNICSIVGAKVTDRAGANLAGEGLVA